MNKDKNTNQERQQEAKEFIKRRRFPFFSGKQFACRKNEGHQAAQCKSRQEQHEGNVGLVEQFHVLILSGQQLKDSPGRVKRKAKEKNKGFRMIRDRQEKEIRNG